MIILNKTIYMHRMFTFCLLIFISLFLSLISLPLQCEYKDEFDIGVYYFPGWKVKSGIMNADPWTNVKKYPEKEPLLGWYNEDSQNIVDRQLIWMNNYGINFIVFDWYWYPNRGVGLDHAIKLYKLSKEKGEIKYIILWANHFDSPNSISEFRVLVSYWINSYFLDKEYKKINGKPIVIVFEPRNLEKQSRKLGTNSRNILSLANQLAKDRGFDGIYFVGVSQAINSEVNGFLYASGYSAVTGYNYHFGLSGKYENRKKSHSYLELVSGYLESWKWFLINSKLPYWLPVTSGWDRRPKGGSDDPMHDKSQGNPSDFQKHLLDAKNIIKYQNYYEKRIIICCWNEYAEGSVIEPTKRYGFEFLDAVKNVFK